MKTVRLKRDQLLEILRENRKNHRDGFLEALEGYREQAIAELEKMLEEAKDKKRIRRTVTLAEPMDQTKDYDRVIKMLEMSIDEEVELERIEGGVGLVNSYLAMEV